MKNIGKILLLVLGVALFALGVKGLMDVPGQQTACLQTGKLLFYTDKRYS